MTSSGKSVQATVLGMITMALPHIQLISEAIPQPICINDPPIQSLEPLLQYRHVFIIDSYKGLKNGFNHFHYHFGHFFTPYRHLRITKTSLC